MSQSPLCNQLFIAPGNAGTSNHGTNVSLHPNDFQVLKPFILEKNIQMVVVGPEEPLVRGIYDFFKNDPELAEVNLIGPSAEGAQLEGSKAYGKKFMADFNIPTAAYREFTKTELTEGLEYLSTCATPIVLKADGLAAGKGVLICTEIEEAQREFKAMLEGKFGEASSRIIVEEFLDGIEYSVFALTDGNHYQILPEAKDYKRIGEGDTGLNTGGMGAVSPVSFVDDILIKKVEERIIKPTIDGLRIKNIPYKGFVFFGLIIVKGEPFVIEYNCRLGDPETEVVLPRLKNDLVELFVAVNEGNIQSKIIETDDRAVTTIMLVSGGYPEQYEKGKQIQNFQEIENSLIFHAGTKSVDGKILTNGGRVMAITSYGIDFQTALAYSKKNAQQINFEGKYFRKDIGFDL